MNVLIALAARFVRTPDGRVWTRSVYHYSFWQRYLAVFDGVRVLARVGDVPAASGFSARADGPELTFVPIPDYVGLKQFMRRALAVRRAVQRGLREDEAVVLRVDSNVASLLCPALWRENRPYGVEVVGDPRDAFAPGAVHHLLRPLFRWWFSSRLRRQCARACAAAYVTQSALQQRYPPGRGAFATHYSNVDMPEEAFVSARVTQYDRERNLRLIHIGSLAQMYKGPDVLLEAVRRCHDRGFLVELAILGDGKHRGELEALATGLSIQDSVRFLGQLPAGPAVREQLDAADVFVLPSRAEGLPRAMIEAMARGLPCIGTAVGGIPELLSQEYLVPVGDAGALAAKIQEVAVAPGLMRAMSEQNLGRARDYHNDVLSNRRIEFYTRVRDRTRQWMAEQ
jgi:glycosyltransferase involved in cell wall biosynthesis